VAKPLLEVGGAPILSHLLRRVECIPELTEVVVAGNHRFAESLIDWSNSIGCRVPLSVLDDGVSEADERLGAIGDLIFALRQVPNEDEDLLVVAGDNLLDFDLAPLYRDFKAEGKPMLVTRRVDHGEGPSPYNAVRVDERGQVLEFQEKPRHPFGDMSAIALYFLRPETPRLLGEYLASGGNSDAPGHFISWLVSVESVFARPMLGRWFDIGSLESLREARESWGL
jgi:glucose-1-phosphate thymidylyltransferase